MLRSVELGCAGVKLIISSLLLEELLVGAPFDYLALLKHHNGVGMADGGQTVGNYKCGFALHKPVQTVLYVPLGAGIDRACGLVKHQNRGVGNGGAGDIQKLA